MPHCLSRIALAIIFVISFISGYAQNFQWAYEMNGPESSFLNDLEVINGNQLLSSGSVSNNTDFDLLISEDLVTTTFASVPFFGIYNTDGSLANSLVVEAPGTVERTAMFAAGDFIAGGEVAGDALWGPNADVMSIPDTNGNDIFLCRFNSNLELIWQWSMGGNSSDSLNDVVIGDDNRIYFCGQYRGQISLNIDGVTTEFFTHDFLDSGDLLTPDGFIGCMHPNGNLMWFHGVGGIGFDEVSCINQDADMIALGGYSTSDMYFDENLMYSSPFNSIYVVGASNNAEFGWVRNSNSFNNETFIGGIAFTDSLIQIVGSYLYLDFDDFDMIDNLSGLNSMDAFYAGFELDGTVSFQHSMGGQMKDEFNFLNIRGENEIITCTTHGTNTSFGINDYVSLSGYKNGQSSSVVVYNAGGDVISHLTIMTHDYTRINAVARIGSDYYLAVKLSGTATFNYDEFVEISSDGEFNAVLAKYGVCLQPVLPEILLSDTIICRDDSVEVTLSGGQLNGCEDWAWGSWGGGQLNHFNGDTSVVIYPFYTNPILVWGVGGCVGTSSVEAWSTYIEVLSSPGGEVSVWNFSDDPCDFNAQYSADIAGPDLTYIWEPPVSDTYYAHDLCEGIYILTVTMENGCYFTDTLSFQTVGINDESTLKAPFDYYISAENGTINLETTLSDLELFIYDLSGRVTINTRLKKGQNSISTDNLAEGTYITTIRDGWKQYMFKWVKSKR
jgi:hypothetical protein